MTRIRKINVSQVEGGTANNTDIDEIRPFGETAFYIDDSGPPDKLTLMMFDGVRTHQKSKVLSPGVLFGSNADSGDGNNYDTIKLIPDAALHSNGSNQYIIVDPTAPNHIHIRAGGTIDDSNADLFLGGELTHVKVSDGYDNVVIRTSTVGEGVTPHDWTFGNNGYLTFPDGTETSGQGIWPLVDNGFGITLTRNVELSAVAAVNSGEDVLYIDISENDDISVVNVLWQLNTGTLTAPILTPVTNSITPEPGIYSISVSGFTFVPGETYTFRSDSIDAVDWVFMPTGELRTSGLGTISHYPGSTSSLKFEVPSSNDIVLRTAGGDLTYGADGSVTLPNGGAIRIDGANIEVGGMTNFNVEALGVVNVYTNDGAHQWQFGDDGALSLPANGVINSSTYSGFSLRSRHDEPIGNLVGSNILISPGQVSINYQVEDQGVPTPGYQWDFNYVTQALDLADGGLKFADNTVQTTAWTGTGTADTGNVTFDDNTIQGNTLGTVGTQITVSTNYLGVTSQNSNVFPLSKTADTDQVQIGWIIKGTDGVGQTITNKIDSGSYWSFYVAGGIQTSYPITIESADYQLGGGAQLILAVDPGDSSVKSWTFDSDGSVTFPDATVQTTAYTGNAATVDITNTNGIDTNYSITFVENRDGAEILRADVDLTFNSATNTLTAGNFSGDGSTLTGVATKTSGEWAVTAGTNTYSFTVPADGTYIMWVKGNIPNGIITWNATASVSNTNVPTIGTQYAWNYTGGGSPILLTSIPDQIKGVAGTISTDATYAGITSNRFDFGISNTSGSTQTIYYGYTKIS